LSAVRILDFVADKSLRSRLLIYKRSLKVLDEGLSEILNEISPIKDFQDVLN